MRAISTVADLLDLKGRNVFAIDSNATLSQAAQVMLDNDINSLVVLGPDKKLQGLITSRDVLRVTARGGSAVDNTPVHAVMTTNLRTTTENAGIEQVESTMIEHRFRHLPVLKGDEVVGLITRIDVLRHYLDKQHWLSRELEAYITGIYPQ